MSTARTDLARATAGYDENHRDQLIAAITTAMAEASICSDANVMAIRTTETVDALAICLAGVLALVPDMDVPSRLRERVDHLAKRIRRNVAQARADGVGDILGAAQGGHA